MNTTIWTIIGIVITLVTFALVFWRTESARKERERHVHKDIVMTVARLLAQGQDEIELSVIESLIKSKSRENNINISISDELPKIIDDLVCQFSENEFITHETRKTLIDKAFNLRKGVEKRTPKLAEVTEELKEPNRSYKKFQISALLSISAALVAAIVTYIALYLLSGTTTNVYLYMYIIIFIIIILALISYLINYQMTKRKKIISVSQVEQVLENLVQNTLVDILPAGNISRNVRSSDEVNVSIVDFLVTLREGERIPINIKSGAIDSNTLNNMTVAMRGMTAKRGVIITSSQISNNIRKTAIQENIIVIDGISSELELITKIKALF